MKKKMTFNYKLFLLGLLFIVCLPITVILTAIGGLLSGILTGLGFTVIAALETGFGINIGEL